ncbi:MAG TPA: right-handed parallel beta-helix repeat-containing protein, partial [Miltoncostaeaceae bacterium]|nr:right-handed parallel beta-helix repeat-containing protein [Miltoncostaeaceae bacterium]
LERETGSPADRLREAIALANNEVHRLAGADPALRGMACVLTVALVADGRVTVGHVGDSRLYLFAGGTAKKLTRDHSPVGEREDRGELAEREAMRHPRRNEIYRDVGSVEHNPNDEEFVDVLDLPFEPDSAFLLCTDGLSDQLSSADISATVHAFADDPATVVGRLVQAANDAGGKDNVTVVFFAGGEFAAKAARAGRARGDAAGHPGENPGRRGSARRSLLASRPLVLWYGLLLGAAAAALAFLLATPLQQWLFDQTRPASWARTWRVGADPADDVATIGEALRRAARGDVVEVGPGEYQERVVVDRDVRLVSRNPRQARIASPPGARQPWTAVEVRGGMGSVISGFTIAGDASRPLAVGILVGAAGVSIEDVEISGAVLAGLMLQGGSRAVVRGSHLHDNDGPGVVVQPLAWPRLLHNLVAANGRTGPVPRPGIELEEGASLDLFGNIIAGNGQGEIAGAPAALRAEWQRDNIIGIPDAAPAKPAKPGPARRR